MPFHRAIMFQCVQIAHNHLNIAVLPAKNLFDSFRCIWYSKQHQKCKLIGLSL